MAVRAHGCHDRQEWNGQRFKKIYVRKIIRHEEKFFQLSFKGIMIRFDLNMEHDAVYGKFVLTVCIYSILYSCKKISKWKEQIVFMNICK